MNAVAIEGKGKRLNRRRDHVENIHTVNLVSSKERHKSCHSPVVTEQDAAMAMARS